MPKPKKNKLENFENGKYKHIHIQSTLSPIGYKEMIDCMEVLGITNESAFIKMTIKNFIQKNRGFK